MHQRGIGPNAVGGCMDKTDRYSTVISIPRTSRHV